jgi:hypothetical protein
MKDRDGAPLYTIESPWPCVNLNNTVYLFWWIYHLMGPRVEFTDGIMMDLPFATSEDLYPAEYSLQNTAIYTYLKTAWPGKKIIPNIADPWWLNRVYAMDVVRVCGTCYLQFAGTLDGLLARADKLEGKDVYLSGPVSGLTVET